jgi:5-methylcytosine-specific restriction endonuclease McrA
MADQGRVVSAHETVDHIVVTINELPGNVPKQETPKFQKNAKHLLEELKLGCWLCQFQRKPQGTGALEVHHMIEWTEWNDVDPAIATKLLGCFNLNKYSGQPVSDPDDLANLIVPHESCHRGLRGQQNMSGAHYTPFPIWFAQGAAKDGVEIAGDVNHLLDRTGTSGKQQLDTEQQVGSEVVEKFTVVVDDPAHPQRKESETFHQSREKLIKEVGKCWLCQFQAHPRGEGPLEAHHLVEWSEWNDSDPERVTKLCGLIKASPYSGQPVTTPDDIANLVLLHETCHIGKNAEHAMSGVHYIPLPIWLAQGAAKSGVTIVEDHQHLLSKLGGLHLLHHDQPPAPPPAPSAPPAEHQRHRLAEHRRGFVLFGIRFGK